MAIPLVVFLVLDIKKSITKSQDQTAAAGVDSNYKAFPAPFYFHLRPRFAQANFHAEPSINTPAIDTVDRGDAIEAVGSTVDQQGDQWVVVAQGGARKYIRATLLDSLASFDCFKASSAVETEICSRADLSRLDAEVAAGYRTQPRTQARLDAQREFQKGRDVCVGAAEGLGPCLTRNYEARKAKLSAVQAPAGIPTPTPSYQSADPEMTTARTIEQPDWLRRPSADELQAHYPPRARRMNITGRVVLSCAVTVDGMAIDCEVLSETPGGYGFSQAALELTPSFRFRPMRVNGLATGGGVIRIPMSFRTGE